MLAQVLESLNFVMQLNQRDRVQAEPLALAQVLRTSIVSLCQSERVALEIFQV